MRIGWKLTYMDVPRPDCQTPVLFLIHRRPRHASRVLDGIRQARTARLLVAADGPENDAACQETRRIVLEGIDWPCDVVTRFSETRLGCRRAVASALDWAFAHHEALVVLEDDCVPAPGFFGFCQAMLERYHDSEEIMQICGSNLIGSCQRGASYFFSRFGPIWGWASWRRAWESYDVELKAWSEIRNSGRLKILCPEPFEAAWRKEVLDEVHRGDLDTWDYQWAFAKLACGGLNIVPSTNLVSNIGFGHEATHTSDPNDPRADLPTADLSLPLSHPEQIQASEEADRRYLSEVVGLPKTLWSAAGLRRSLRMLLKR